MTTVIQIIHNDSAGTYVRMSDGSQAFVPHPDVPHIGQPLPGAAVLYGVAMPQEPKAPTLEQMASDEQAVSNVLSQIVKETNGAD